VSCSNLKTASCPPPGAGKTNVAVLTIMHQLGLHRGADGEIDKSAFKIVYIAPMKVGAAAGGGGGWAQGQAPPGAAAGLAKPHGLWRSRLLTCRLTEPRHPDRNPPLKALVAEMVGNFTKRLSEAYGIQVRELTGDINLTKQEIDETQVGGRGGGGGGARAGAADWEGLAGAVESLRGNRRSGWQAGLTADGVPPARAAPPPPAAAAARSSSPRPRSGTSSPARATTGARCRSPRAPLCRAFCLHLTRMHPPPPPSPRLPSPRALPPTPRPTPAPTPTSSAC
jgi:hypothetical protein